MIEKEKLLNNPDLAKIVACLTGDGNVQISGWRYIISFYSKHLSEIDEFKRIFEKLFGISGKIYIDKRTSVKCINSGTRYKLFFCSKEITLFLQEIGVPVGNKTNVNFQVPSWIMRGSNKIKGAYLRGLFDNEGSIYCTRGKKLRWRICFRMAKNEVLKKEGLYFFEQLRSLLFDFGVKSSPVRFFKLNIRKDGSKSIGLMFDIEASSFANFFKNIGFEHPLKKEKLASCIRGQAAKIYSEHSG